jgi:hypothetical protein
MNHIKLHHLIFGIATMTGLSTLGFGLDHVSGDMLYGSLQTGLGAIALMFFYAGLNWK